MRIQSLRIKLITFIVLEVLVIVVVLHLYLSSNSESQSRTAPDITRDYVMNQPDLEDLEEVHRPLIDTPKEAKGIRTYRGDTNLQDTKHYKCVSLRTFNGSTPICVYPREIDNMISAHVMDFHTWEEDWLNSTAKIFRKHSDFVYLDLGCNIGVYTLFVAKLGALVYALDPNRDSLNLLAKSLRLGKLQENVTLILNAISDKQENVTLEVTKGNIGGSMIKSVDKLKKNSIADNIVEAITLDDLGAILQGKKVFIKMDIESYELNAIIGARTFFQTADVRYIQMEWTHFRYNEKGRTIIDNLVKHGLFPYADVHGREQLNPAKYYSWPENIIWIKR